MSFPLILRWPNRDASHEPLLKQLGADQILGDEPIPDSITRALWPGIRGAPRRRGDDDVASASREAWVDANGYLVAYERALHPERPVVLAETLQEAERSVPFETLEIALIEARVNGGNFVLSVEPRYREALVKQDSKALAAWNSLATTAAWLRKNESLFGRPVLPIITAIVEPGMPTSEIANLLYRRGGSPALVSAANIPPPNPNRILALVAAGLKTVPKQVFDHAAAGSSLIIDSAPQVSWKLIKQDKDRNIYTFGKGQIFAYHKRAADPSEFALDVIDIVSHKRRAARLWNAPASIPLATEGPLLHIINYGSPSRDEVQARIHGQYSKATLLRPEAAAAELKVYRRGTLTEVFPPSLQRLAVVQFG
jgi:hypothetical protein